MSPKPTTSFSMSVCASAGLDAHRLGIVCLSLRIHKHALLDSGILFYIPHFPESESKQSLPASRPAVVCSAFSKMAHNVRNVHCPSSPLQKFEFATNMFCAFEISPLGEKYINYSSFPLCFTYCISLLHTTRSTIDMSNGSFLRFFKIGLNRNKCLCLDLWKSQFTTSSCYILHTVF